MVHRFNTKGSLNKAVHCIEPVSIWSVAQDTSWFSNTPQSWNIVSNSLHLSCVNIYLLHEKYLTSEQRWWLYFRYRASVMYTTTHNLSTNLAHTFLLFLPFVVTFLMLGPVCALRILDLICGIEILDPTASCAWSNLPMAVKVDNWRLFAYGIPSFMIVDYSIYLVTGRDLLPPGKVAKVCNIRQLIVKGASGLLRVLGRGRVYQYAASSVKPIFRHLRVGSRSYRFARRLQTQERCVIRFMSWGPYSCFFSSSTSRRLQRKFVTGIMYLSS